MSMIAALPLVALVAQPIAIQPPKRLLILGNSLVLSVPNAAYDWWGYWGMAASDADHDFAHILQAKLAAFYGNPVELRARHVSPMETRPDKFDLKQYHDEIEWKADIVVIRMGDNVPGDEATKTKFLNEMAELIQAVTKPGATLVCTGRWYPNEDLDKRMQALCELSGGRWVTLADMYQQPAFMATSDGLYSDGGVLTHPSNAGHVEIARRLYDAIAPSLYIPWYGVG